jgi:hypothetical protein
VRRDEVLVVPWQIPNVDAGGVPTSRGVSDRERKRAAAGTTFIARERVTARNFVIGDECARFVERRGLPDTLS